MTEPTDPATFTDTSGPTGPSGSIGRIDPRESSSPTDNSSRTDNSSPAVRTATPAAQAASRARRIGGRPGPAPQTALDRPHPTPGGTATDTIAPSEKRPKPGPKRRIEPESPPVKVKWERVKKQRGDRPPVRTWLPAAMLAVVLVAIVVLDLSWLGGLSHPGGHQMTTSAADREKLLSQATTRVALVSSYNYQHIDADAKAAEAGMIEPFKSTYDKSIQTVIKPLAAQVKAVVSCTVQTAAISSVSGDGQQAVVLIYAQLSTQNSTTAGQSRLDIATIQVTMTKQHGNWMISQLARE
jgi:Mce-associated membrane protein